MALGDEFHCQGFHCFGKTHFPQFSGWDSKRGFWPLSGTGASWKSDSWLMFGSSHGPVGFSPVGFAGRALLCVLPSVWDVWVMLVTLGQGPQAPAVPLARASCAQGTAPACPVCHESSDFLWEGSCKDWSPFGLGFLSRGPAAADVGNGVSSLCLFASKNVCKGPQLELC